MENLIYDDIVEKFSKIKRFVFTDEILSKDVPLRYNFISWNHGNYIYIQMEVIFIELDEKLQQIFMKCISRIKRSGKHCTYVMDNNGHIGVRFLYYY